MPGIEDWLNRPLNIIQSIFDADGKNCSTKVSQYFNERLLDQDSLAWVPSLNHTPVHQLKPNTLVRYRCMIQDMFDPEFYLGAYEVAKKNSGDTMMKCGMFQDLAQCSCNEMLNLESSSNITLERQTFYCVPVPAETDWVKEAFAAHCRRPTSDLSTCQSSGVKRSLDDNDTSPVEQVEATGSQTASDKRTRLSDTSLGEGSTSAVDLNFPLQEEKGPACIVKVYDDFGSYKLNSVVEFIGILSTDPELANLPTGESCSAADTSTEMMDDSMEEQAVHSPPPSLVPRLHVLVSYQLQHVNPLLPVNLKSDDGSILMQSLLREVGNVRKQIQLLLQEQLLGDSLAAEYLLLNLVSSVYARRDVIALGKFSLNLIGCQKTGFSQSLQNLLKQLVTKCHLLPLSLSNMNLLRLTPKKDYNANRLMSGALQLSDRTHVILDETALQPGKLDGSGIHNLAAIGNAISWQKLEYDFQFHKTDFQTNLVFVVTSEGKSLLPNDCQIPIEAETAPTTAMIDIESRIQSLIISGKINLNQIRTYLDLIPATDYTLSEEMSKVAQQDFVEVRKADPSRMTQADLHSLLVVARLLSISLGQSSLTREIWEKTKELERERKIRLKNIASSSQRQNIN